MSSRYIFTTDSWKKTALGTSIRLVASHSLEELRRRRPILLVGGVHGDEPEGVRLAQETESWLRHEVEVGHSDDFAPWILIPCLNVDGFAKKQRVNGQGVDINRNYPSANWKPTAEKPRYNPGPSPGSELEVQGMVEILTGWQPRLVIHCHSWQPMIVYTGAPARNDAERLARNSGYALSETIGYPTPGSLSQFGWHDNQIPIICIEEQDELKDLSTIWPRFSTAMREIFSDKSERK